MSRYTLVKSGQYYDSVTLMQVAQALTELDGVEDAAVVMGTPANKGILSSADLLTAEAQAAAADDLIIAVRASTEAQALAALAATEGLLKASRAPKGGGSETPTPRTLAAAAAQLPEAQMALISVAGRYAAGVGQDALSRGLHVFLFSDNVPVEDEIALKQLGREKGLLVMGPDAGTAIINGVALGFANAVISGPVGVVAASGTGLQSVTCDLTRLGIGITQAIGTGGRDLSAAVGGVMMIEGIKALQADPATEVLLLVSKPPAPEIAEIVLEQLRSGNKPSVVCFLGGDRKAIKATGAVPAATLEEAAILAAALAKGESKKAARRSLASRDELLAAQAKSLQPHLKPEQRYFRGLFSGGTFCYEAQLILAEMLGEGAVSSNAPVDKRYRMADSLVSSGHVAVDLGEDEFTVGRLHPMLDPSLRNRRILQEARDPTTAVILLDIVLGYGVHPDPAGAAVDAIRQAQEHLRSEGREVLFVASVCGTEADPQNAKAQEDRLRAAGVLVLPTNAAATKLAGYVLR